MQEKELTQIIKRLEKELDNAEEGYLVIDTSRSSPRFEYRIRGKRIRRLNEDEDKLIRHLAQKAYNQKVLKIVKDQLKFIRQYRKLESIDLYYDSLGQERKSLIKPVIPTRGQKINKWLSMNHNFSNMENTVLIGGKYRSKSEYILAEIFKKYKIEFLYEKELFLKGFGKVYPDFTFFDPDNERETYWEHFGMMDDNFYREKSFDKIHAYIKNGIFPGKGLIMTFETNNEALDYDLAEEMVKSYLL